MHFLSLICGTFTRALLAHQIFLLGIFEVETKQTSYRGTNTIVESLWVLLLLFFILFSSQKMLPAYYFIWKTMNKNKNDFTTIIVKGCQLFFSTQF
jgi:hypothetical protein